MRALAVVAGISCLAHLAAALGSLLFLQGGSAVTPDPAAREAYIATHLATWRLGWVAWTLASLSLVALLAWLHRPAALVAAAGLVFDLPSQLALASPILPLERAAYYGTGVIANTIYTAALAWAAWRAPIPAALRAGAIPIVVFGIGTTIASYTLHPPSLFVATGGLAVLMILWSGAIGAWAWRAS